MKSISRSTFFSCFLILAFCFLPVASSFGKSAMDMVPYDSLACVSLSDLDVVFHLVAESPEWQELLGMEAIQEQLTQAKQPISFITMFLGISVEEFADTFGHRTVLTLMGMMGPMPVAGLIIDPGSHEDKLEHAVKQVGASFGAGAVEEKEYRDVTYSVISNENIKVKYGFLDSFLIAGVGGGFEKLVDHYKDDGKSINDSPNFQFMAQKVSLSSNIRVYADLERAAPMLEMFANIGSGEAENQPAEMIKQLVFSSAKAFALGLNLSGQTQEIYLHLKQEEPNPITDLVLAPCAPMSSARLVPFDNGVMVGLNIGDPVEMLDRGLKLAKMTGVQTEKIESKIRELEGILGIDLREDLLSTLTGEVTAITILPEERIDFKTDKLKAFIELSSAPSVNFIGVKDEKKLSETAKKLLKIVEIEPLTLKEESYKGRDIHTKVVPLSATGIALMPVYTFHDDLLIISNIAESVRYSIDMLESSPVTEIQEKLSDSRVLIYLDVGGVANFVIDQGFAEEVKIPEEILAKFSSLGSIAASVSLGPDGAGIRLISTSDDNWATKILRGALIATYAKAAEAQEEAEQEETEEKNIEDEN